MKADMTILNADLLAENKKNFENYSIDFEKQHKKWKAEQTKLKRDIESNLENYKYLSKLAIKIGFVVLLGIPVFIAITLIYTLHANAFQILLLWTAQHEDISIFAGVVAVIFTVILIFVSGLVVNDKLHNR